MPATHSKKLGQRHAYHWVTSPFLLITLCNCLGTEDINCCSFASGIFAHSWCIQDLSWSTVRGRHCLIILFMMHLGKVAKIFLYIGQVLCRSWWFDVKRTHGLMSWFLSISPEGTYGLTPVRDCSYLCQMRHYCMSQTPSLCGLQIMVQ